MNMSVPSEWPVLVSLCTDKTYTTEFSLCYPLRAQRSNKKYIYATTKRESFGSFANVKEQRSVETGHRRTCSTPRLPSGRAGCKLAFFCWFVVVAMQTALYYYVGLWWEGQQTCRLSTEVQLSHTVWLSGDRVQHPYTWFGQRRGTDTVASWRPVFLKKDVVFHRKAFHIGNHGGPISGLCYWFTTLSMLLIHEGLWTQLYLLPDGGQ